MFACKGRGQVGQNIIIGYVRLWQRLGFGQGCGFICRLCHNGREIGFVFFECGFSGGDKVGFGLILKRLIGEDVGKRFVLRGFGHISGFGVEFCEFNAIKRGQIGDIVGVVFSGKRHISHGGHNGIFQ